jgi:hypothetical protein
VEKIKKGYPGIVISKILCQKIRATNHKIFTIKQALKEIFYDKKQKILKSNRYL